MGSLERHRSRLCIRDRRKPGMLAPSLQGRIHGVSRQQRCGPCIGWLWDSSWVWSNSNCVSLSVTRAQVSPGLNSTPPRRSLNSLVYLSALSFYKFFRVGSGRVVAPVMNCGSSWACTMQKSCQLSHMPAPAFGISSAYCSTQKSYGCTLTRAV